MATDWPENRQKGIETSLGKWESLTTIATTTEVGVGLKISALARER